MKKTNIKDALWLTCFEMRHSLLSYVILVSIFLLLAIFTPATLATEKSNVGMGMDYYFLFILFALPGAVKMQPFRGISVGNYTYLAPIYILAKQLPINRSTYIMYQLFYRFLLSFIVTIVYLMALYPAWDKSIPFSHYMSFILLWIALTFTLHLLDAYIHFGYNVIIWIALIIIIVPILLLITLLIFHIHFYTFGFVHWTLDIAVQYPIYMTIAALLLIIFNVVFWNKMFRRKMNKMDLYY